MIFVFGSNLSGIHGAGAAREAAKYHGAIRGVGEGLQGNSYALPTKGINITRMELHDVIPHIIKFLKFAQNNPHLSFKVTRVGCGLAGFDDEEVAPMFASAPSNCFFDLKWKRFMPKDHYYEYWGTY